MKSQIRSIGLELIEIKAASRLLPTALATKVVSVARKPLTAPWVEFLSSDAGEVGEYLRRFEPWRLRMRDDSGSAVGNGAEWISVSVLGKRVLVLAPHPDDETIGVGGIVTLLVDSGAEVDVVFLAGGEASTGFLGNETSEVRKKEAERACEILRVRPHFLDVNESSPYEERSCVPVRLVELIDSIDPSSILVTSFGESHPEHRWAAKVLGEALRSKDWAGTIGLYEIWTLLDPTHLVDITPVFGHKWEAIEAYDFALRTVDYLELALLKGVYRASQGGRPGTIAEALILMAADECRATC